MNNVKTLFSTLIIVILASCASDVKDVVDSLECAALISEIDQENDNESCADSIADIERVENSCGEFLSDESKELIASIRANCTDN